jgi:hypothetical protein
MGGQPFDEPGEVGDQRSLIDLKGVQVEKPLLLLAPHIADVVIGGVGGHCE